MEGIKKLFQGKHGKWFLAAIGVVAIFALYQMKKNAAATTAAAPQNYDTGTAGSTATTGGSSNGVQASDVVSLLKQYASTVDDQFAKQADQNALLTEANKNLGLSVNTSITNLQQQEYSMFTGITDKMTQAQQSTNDILGGLSSSIGQSNTAIAGLAGGLEQSNIAISGLAHQQSGFADTFSGLQGQISGISSQVNNQLLSKAQSIVASDPHPQQVEQHTSGGAINTISYDYTDNTVYDNSNPSAFNAVHSTVSPTYGFGGADYNNSSPDVQQSIVENENRLSSDSSFVQSEQARTEQVIANREAAGQDTTEQVSYRDYLSEMAS